MPSGSPALESRGCEHDDRRSDGVGPALRRAGARSSSWCGWKDPRRRRVRDRGGDPPRGSRGAERRREDSAAVGARNLRHGARAGIRRTHRQRLPRRSLPRRRRVVAAQHGDRRRHGSNAVRRRLQRVRRRDCAGARRDRVRRRRLLDGAGEGAQAPRCARPDRRARLLERRRERSRHLAPLDNDELYVGGNFTSIGGASRRGVAQLDTAGGLATGWDAGLDGNVFALAAFNDVSLSRRARSRTSARAPANYLGSVFEETATPTSWDPDPDDTATALCLDPSRSSSTPAAISRRSAAPSATPLSSTPRPASCSAGGLGRVQRLRSCTTSLDGATLYSGRRRRFASTARDLQAVRLVVRAWTAAVPARRRGGAVRAATPTRAARLRHGRPRIPRRRRRPRPSPHPAADPHASPDPRSIERVGDARVVAHTRLGQALASSATATSSTSSTRWPSRGTPPARWTPCVGHRLGRAVRRRRRRRARDDRPPRQAQAMAAPSRPPRQDARDRARHRVARARDRPRRRACAIAARRSRCTTSASRPTAALWLRAAKRTRSAVGRSAARRLAARST